MILKTRQVGDPVLRKAAKAVSLGRLKTPEIQSLIDSMIETLRDHPGVGLAAPQVGESLAIIVLEDLARYHKRVNPKVLDDQKRKPFRLKTIINPVLEIINSEQQYHFEGCLSVTGYRAVVARASEVIVTGLDRNGKSIRFKAAGWQARILQHEVDHLGGTIYLDSMTSKSFMTDQNFAKSWADKVGAELKSF